MLDIWENNSNTTNTVDKKEKNIVLSAHISPITLINQTESKTLKKKLKNLTFIPTFFSPKKLQS